MPKSMLQRIRTNRYSFVYVFVFMMSMFVWVLYVIIRVDAHHSMCTRLLCVCREMQAVENLLTMMSFVVQRQKKQLQLRNMCCEERVWKSHLNYIMALAHVALLYEGLDKLHGALQHKLDCSYFTFTVFFLGTTDWLHHLH